MIPLRSPISLALSLLAAALTILASACGGGGSAGDVSVREQLQGMVLRVEGLPAGLKSSDASFSSNEDVSSSLENSEDELAKLEAQGRLLGYQVVFEPGPDAGPDMPVIGIENSVSLYRAADGAATSFAEAVERARATDWAASHPGLEEFEVREIERPELADDVLWLRISGFGSEEREGLAMDDFVLLRRDNVRSFIRVITFFRGETDRDAYLQEIKGWAARQVELIDDALR